MHALKSTDREFLIYNLLRVIFGDDGITMVRMRGEPDVFLSNDDAEAFRRSFAAAMKILSIRREFSPRDSENGLVVQRVDR